MSTLPERDVGMVVVGGVEPPVFVTATDCEIEAFCGAQPANSTETPNVSVKIKVCVGEIIEDVERLS